MREHLLHERCSKATETQQLVAQSHRRADQRFNFPLNVFWDTVVLTVFAQLNLEK